MYAASKFLSYLLDITVFNLAGTLLMQDEYIGDVKLVLLLAFTVICALDSKDWSFYKHFGVAYREIIVIFVIAEKAFFKF